MQTCLEKSPTSSRTEKQSGASQLSQQDLADDFHATEGALFFAVQSSVFQWFDRVVGSDPEQYVPAEWRERGMKMLDAIGETYEDYLNWKYPTPGDFPF